MKDIKHRTCLADQKRGASAEEIVRAAANQRNRFTEN
jgi:hypothetical protein